MGSTRTRYLSTVEVCEILGIHRNTLYRWLNQGRLEAINLGGTAGLRFREDEIERFLAEQTVRGRVRDALDGSEPSGEE